MSNAPQPFAWPAGKDFALSLTMDDARMTQVDVGLPLLAKHGVRATFYVSLSPVRKRTAEWQAALRAGHEVGNHSRSHPCSRNYPFNREGALETLTIAKMEEDLAAADRELQAMLGIKPDTFAYPCGQTFVGGGERTTSYVPVVARRFLAGRGFGQDYPNDPAWCDLAHLYGIQCDTMTITRLQDWLAMARGQRGWLILVGHEVAAEGRQATSVALIEEICRLANDQGSRLWVDTVANISRHILANRKAPQP